MCVLVSGLGIYCEIIFTRSRVLVLVFSSCVGGREIWNSGRECKGHLLFPGKSTDYAFWAKLCPGWRIIMTGKLRGQKTV